MANNTDYVELGVLAAAVAGFVGFIGLCWKYPSFAKATTDALNQAEERRNRFMPNLEAAALRRLRSEYERDLAFVQSEERMIRMRTIFTPVEKSILIGDLYRQLDRKYAVFGLVLGKKQPFMGNAFLATYR